MSKSVPTEQVESGGELCAADQEQEVPSTNGHMPVMPQPADWQQPDPGEGWRLLAPGETFAEGDEVQYYGYDAWTPRSRWEWGLVQGGFYDMANPQIYRFCPTRRRVDATTQTLSSTTTEPLEDVLDGLEAEASTVNLEGAK